jgi:hypothetical protein
MSSMWLPTLDATSAMFARRMSATRLRSLERGVALPAAIVVGIEANFASPVAQQVLTRKASLKETNEWFELLMMPTAMSPGAPWRADGQ